MITREQTLAKVNAMFDALEAREHRHMTYAMVVEDEGDA